MHTSATLQGGGPADRAVVSAMSRSLSAEAEVLTALGGHVDLGALNEAVVRLSNAPLVVTCASGSSGYAAAKFAHSLCCVERTAKFMPPYDAIHGGMGCIHAGDAVVMVSRGGKTAELFPIMDVVLAKKADLIVVTENAESQLARAADLVLTMKVARESDPLGLMASSSFLATVAIFDALIAGIIQHTGFSREQFALIHPGGAVGELLNRGGEVVA